MWVSAILIDTDNWNIKYRRAIYPDGSEWLYGSSDVADTLLAYAGYLSLSEVAGRPAVCYTDAGNGLFYSYAQNVEGTSWSAPQKIDSQDASYSSTLAYINGMPMIAYGNNETGVSFAVATATTGTLNWIAVEP